MSFNLSQASLLKMQGVDKGLQDIVKKAITLSQVDFKVVQGLRTQAYQDKLYAQGRTSPGHIVTWTRDSKHIHGLAVDLAAFVDGTISWDEKYYFVIAMAMKQAARDLNIPIIAGIDWHKPDYGHFEIWDKT